MNEVLSACFWWQLLEKKTPVCAWCERAEGHEPLCQNDIEVILERGKEYLVDR